MDPAETMFFEGAPLAHVVAFRERERLARRTAADQSALRRRQPGAALALPAPTQMLGSPR